MEDLQQVIKLVGQIESETGLQAFNSYMSFRYVTYFGEWVGTGVGILLFVWAVLFGLRWMVKQDQCTYTVIEDAGGKKTYMSGCTDKLRIWEEDIKKYCPACGSMIKKADE